MFKNWLVKSGITEDVQEIFSLSTATHDILDECIAIPVHDIDGIFIFNKYRKNPMLDDKRPKYLYDKGGVVTLYGYFKAKEHKTILITEGEKDCMVAWSNNIPAVTSTGGAMSFQKEWGELLKDKEVIVCLDNDSTGGNGMVKILDVVPHAKVLFLPDRPGVKDISDYVASGGDLHTLLKTAKILNNVADVKQDRAERVALWKTTYFHDSFIKEHTKPKITFNKKVTFKGDDLTSVKDIPINSLLPFKHNKTNCIWHKEKTPSLNYYPENNNVYCFGCNKYGDVIDVYMQQNNLTFKEALKELKNKIL